MWVINKLNSRDMKKHVNTQLPEHMPWHGWEGETCLRKADPKAAQHGELQIKAATHELNNFVSNTASWVCISYVVHHHSS